MENLSPRLEKKTRHRAACIGASGLRRILTIEAFIVHVRHRLLSVYLWLIDVRGTGLAGRLCADVWPPLAVGDTVAPRWEVGVLPWPLIYGHVATIRR